MLTLQGQSNALFIFLSASFPDFVLEEDSVSSNITSPLFVNNNFVCFCLQEGFLEFYEGGPEKRTKDSWPSFKTICSYAAAGLGILTLGAFLSQKS